MLQGRLHIA